VEQRLRFGVITIKLADRCMRFDNKARLHLLCACAGLLLAFGYVGMTGSKQWESSRVFVGLLWGVMYAIGMTRSPAMNPGFERVFFFAVTLPLVAVLAWLSMRDRTMPPVFVVSWGVAFLDVQWAIMRLNAKLRSVANSAA
jgi:hypothetical protein